MAREFRDLGALAMEAVRMEQFLALYGMLRKPFEKAFESFSSNDIVGEVDEYPGLNHGNVMLNVQLSRAISDRDVSESTIDVYVSAPVGGAPIEFYRKSLYPARASLFHDSVALEDCTNDGLLASLGKAISEGKVKFQGVPKEAPSQA